MAPLDCGGSRSEAETAEGNRSATPLFAVDSIHTMRSLLKQARFQFFMV